MPEPSASSLNGKSSFGRTRTGAEVTSSLSFMKESSWGKPQMNLTVTTRLVVVIYGNESSGMERGNT
jgi:hypothetical protein